MWDNFTPFTVQHIKISVYLVLEFYAELMASENSIGPIQKVPLSNHVM